MPLRVLIADDHAVVRKGLRQILADEFGESAAGEARTAAEALALVSRQTWDLVLLDLNLPDADGLEVLLKIKAERPRLPVLMLSMHAEEQFAVRALKAGASGYLSKASAAEELTQAIRKVLAGGRYVSNSLAERLAEAVGGLAERALHEALSHREFQILRLLAAGKTVKEIAGELGLSAKTVSTYRARVLAKMNAQSNADLTRYALQHKLLE